MAVAEAVSHSPDDGREIPLVEALSRFHAIYIKAAAALNDVEENCRITLAAEAPRCGETSLFNDPTPRLDAPQYLAEYVTRFNIQRKGRPNGRIVHESPAEGRLESNGRSPFMFYGFRAIDFTHFAPLVLKGTRSAACPSVTNPG